ncbi:unnamed protein product [Heterobilharzia americana]|nr:unnamed protein product [Heterobilharzia americana]
MFYSNETMKANLYFVTFRYTVRKLTLGTLDIVLDVGGVCLHCVTLHKRLSNIISDYCVCQSTLPLLCFHIYKISLQTSHKPMNNNFTAL